MLTTAQIELFEGDAKQSAKRVLFRDPSFIENKMLPIHRWVPWIAGYSASFVDDVLAAYLPQKSKNGETAIVLDPFAGVGTTLVQAMHNGYRTVGFEINQYAALAARVKVHASFLDRGKLGNLISNLETFTRNQKSLPHKAQASIPKGFRSRIPFFSPVVQQQVFFILDFINDIKDENIRDLFRVAFGSVMVSFSNYTYEPSLGTRPGAGKPLIVNENAIAILVNKLWQMFGDIEWIQTHLRPTSNLPDAHRVFNSNFMKAAKKELSGSPIDLMITSPPYMNNYHYVRNTRPQLYWLSLVNQPSELRQLEEENFGKFWQTVRNEIPVEPLFDSPNLNRLRRKLERTREDKGAYGGPGWANYVTSYFNDAAQFFRVLKNVLKSHSVGVIVIGNSIIQGIEFKVDECLAELAENAGLITDGIHQIRQKRVGASITQSSVRRGKNNGAILYESAVVVRKP